MMSRQRILSMAACATGFAAIVGVLAACSDSDSTPDDTHDTKDSGVGDATPDVETPQVDSGNEQQVDAGPTLTSTTGSTGFVQIRDAYVMAAFREDDTIVRASDTPECVLHSYSVSKPYSEAGTLTIGGEIVDSDGGPSEAITITPDEERQYFFMPEPPPDVGGVFHPGDVFVVHVEGSGSAAFPSMPAQSLPTALVGELDVTKPEHPGGDPLSISSAQPFEITWTPPEDADPNHRVIVQLRELAGEETPRGANVYCSYPIAAGKGTIAASLLAEIKRIASGTSFPVGALDIVAGGFKEFTGGGASYVIHASRDDSSAFVSTAVILQ